MTPNRYASCNGLASILPEKAMVQRRIYPDEKTQIRERVRRHRKNKKPYYAKRAEARKLLEDQSALQVKQVQGVYDVVVIDPPWPVHFGIRELFPNKTSLPYPTMSLRRSWASMCPWLT